MNFIHKGLNVDYRFEEKTFDYPRVTSVLGHFKNWGLIKWRQKLGDAVADFEMNRCALRGTSTHETIEEYLKNEKVTYKSVLSYGLFLNMLNYLNMITNIRCLEQKLVSHNLELQGTVDCVAEVNGSLSVIDFKTSNKPTEKPRDTHLLQTSAYAIMYEELYKEKIESLVIISADELGGSKMFRRDFSEHKNKFLEFLNKYKEEIKQ